MPLVDTSVWVDHLRYGNTILEELLNEGSVLCHKFIVGELACGNLRRRSEILSLLSKLPTVTHADDDEVMQFIENYSLMGKGLGYVDAHLLASAMLTEVRLWTLDKKLEKAAFKIGLAYDSKLR